MAQDGTSENIAAPVDKAEYLRREEERFKMRDVMFRRQFALEQASRITTTLVKQTGLDDRYGDRTLEMADRFARWMESGQTAPATPPSQ